MKIVGVGMLITGIAVGTSGAAQLRYFDPGTEEFLTGILGVPSSLAFAGGGLLVWRQGSRAWRAAALSSAAMITSAIAAIAIRLTSPLATMLGVVVAGAVLWWAWGARLRIRNRARDQSDR
jgi:hypothetical protein